MIRLSHKSSILPFYFIQNSPKFPTPQAVTSLSHGPILLNNFTEKFLKEIYTFNFHFLSLLFSNLLKPNFLTPIQFQNLINPRLFFKLHIIWPQRPIQAENLQNCKLSSLDNEELLFWLCRPRRLWGKECMKVSESVKGEKWRQKEDFFLDYHFSEEGQNYRPGIIVMKTLEDAKFRKKIYVHFIYSHRQKDWRIYTKMLTMIIFLQVKKMDSFYFLLYNNICLIFYNEHAYF